jgi:YebC/PmpR family DNA-binding regulatory protein
MAGHSKWKQIKHKKAAADAKRGAAFTKLIKEITIAARQGGGDPAGNARLRTAIDAAQAGTMPNDNIDRAITKGTGELEGVSYEEVSYEGYGPGGVAIICDCQTDNKNRCVSEIRRIFSKCGGNMGSQGVVAWMFEMKGVIEIEAPGKTGDDMLEVALDAGADEVMGEADFFEFNTAPSDMLPVADKLKAAGFNVTSVRMAKLPKNRTTITGKEAEQNVRLVEALEDSDDVQNVFHNFDIDDSEMEKIMGG